MDIPEESFNEVRQGFLCPVCMKDLCDADTLKEHVATHSISDDDPIDYLKGMIFFNF